VAGIERMVEADRYCVDVLLQIAAVRAALDRVAKLVLGTHVETCVADALASSEAEQRERKLGELMEVLARFGALGAEPAGSGGAADRASGSPRGAAATPSSSNGSEG
jgi:DNA-binding FrmR family transcriptional regulator